MRVYKPTAKAGIPQFLKFKTNLYQTYLLKKVAKKVDKRNIPRNFREFFVYICNAAGLDENGKPCFPEYLRDLVSEIIHEDIDTGVPIHGRKSVYSTPPRHLKSTTALAAMLWVCIFKQRKKIIYASYADSVTKESASVFERMARAIGYAKAGTLDRKAVGSSVCYFRSLGGAITSLGSSPGGTIIEMITLKTGIRSKPSYSQVNSEARRDPRGHRGSAAPAAARRDGFARGRPG